MHAYSTRGATQTQGLLSLHTLVFTPTVQKQ